MNVFHFLFIFLKKKVSSFLFSCISFKYVKLLALVSEFNCFLRSRCSMEMWCPDDIGRDSWDWVGPLAWGRARFTSPEWGGSSSPVKTEPRQVGINVVLDRRRGAASVHPQIAEMSWKREPSMTNNCGSSRARKKSSKKADSTSNGRTPKKAAKCGENPLRRARRTVDERIRGPSNCREELLELVAAR